MSHFVFADIVFEAKLTVVMHADCMLAAGGYPWTVIPFAKRDDYMGALESGSVKQDIEPFTLFLGDLVSDRCDVLR